MTLSAPSALAAATSASMPPSAAAVVAVLAGLAAGAPPHAATTRTSAGQGRGGPCTHASHDGSLRLALSASLVAVALLGHPPVPAGSGPAAIECGSSGLDGRARRAHLRPLAMRRLVACLVEMQAESTRRGTTSCQRSVNISSGSRPQIPTPLVGIEASRYTRRAMDDLYRDYILEHYRQPHNFGPIEHAVGAVRGQQPAVRRPDHDAGPGARRRRGDGRLHRSRLRDQPGVGVAADRRDQGQAAGGRRGVPRR